MACANKRRATRGLSSHPLAKKLWNVRVRCEQPSATHYAYYGGRGIKVCDAWRNNVEAFVTWAESNGYAAGLELDRIDVNGDYSPENCRFISHVKNSRLRRNARCSEEQAEAVRRDLAQGATVRQSADRAGVPYMSAWHIKAGNTWKRTA